MALDIAGVKRNEGESKSKEVFMPINFRHDVDQVLKDAKAQRKPVLLDFSAAPM
ncbi:MAG TPA: hypothetical protein VEL50_09065 [Gemmatimonadales bacterium]|nr:hypothetical protein [Gemmatimonadales bacterium]